MNDWLAGNQFLSGGLVMMLIGALMAIFRQAPDRLWTWLKNRCVISLEVQSNDPAFDWITNWLDAQPYSKRARALSVVTRRQRNESAIEESDEDEAPAILLTPAVGHHFFVYNGKLLWLERIRKNDNPSDGKLASLFPLETYTIRILGKSQETGRQLFTEAYGVYKKNSNARRYVYQSRNGYWRRLPMSVGRPLSSVILPGQMVEEVLADVREFLGSRAWYAQRGIPYHRGYLLEGLPGTGKTSLVTALAHEIPLNLYVLSLASGIGDDDLHELVGSVAPRSMVLIEDVDQAIPSDGTQEGDRKRVSLTALLNCLDGALSADGSLVFMTSNHAEKLAPALVRPGRVDVRRTFGHATEEQAERMFARFYSQESGNGEFRKAFRQAGLITMAELQQVCMNWKDSPEGAIEELASDGVVRERA